MKRLLICAWLLLLTTGALAQATGLRVCETDGSPCRNGIKEIYVSPGVLTLSGQKATIAIGGGGGSGDVVGPASSTDNAVVRFDLATGKLLQNSVVLIGDTGNVTGLGTLNTHTLPGGTDTIALLAATQSFSNKTLASPTVTGNVSADATSQIRFGSNGFRYTNNVGPVFDDNNTGFALTFNVQSLTDNRTVTFPDAALTVAGINLAQTWSANQTFGTGNLRATLPQITTGWNDANGNRILAITATGSATEYITIANNTATNAVSFTASSPTQGASAIAGTPLNLIASPAIAGNTNAGAAAGGSLNFSTGSAARLTSGNAAGGSIVNFLGAGIGTGARGTFQIRGDGGAASSTNTPEFQWYSGYTDASNYSRLIFGVRSGSDTSIISERAGTGSAGQLYIQNTTGGGVFIQVGTTYRWSFPTTGEIGLSSNALSVDAWIRRNATANIQFGQAAAASPVAQITSVQDVAGGTTNTAGATWTLRGSLGTSQGAPGRIHLAGGALIAASGTTQQTAVDRLIVGATKVLTNNTAITLANVNNASNTSVGGRVDYCVAVEDGTDVQYECGSATYGISNKAGVFSGNTVTKAINHQNATAGTLTVTFAISAANPALFSVNANSSLTPSTGFPRITYSFQNLGQQAVAIQ